MTEDGTGETKGSDAGLPPEDLAAIRDLFERYKRYEAQGSDEVIWLYDTEARFTSIKSYPDGTKVPEDLPRTVFLTRSDEFDIRPSQPVVFSNPTFEQTSNGVRISFTVKFGAGVHRPSPIRLTVAKRRREWRIIAKEWEILYQKTREEVFKRRFRL